MPRSILRCVLLPAVAATALFVVPKEGVGQAREDTTVSEPVCFSAGPAHRCKSFLLFDLSWHQPFVHPGRRGEFVPDAGLVVNEYDTEVEQVLRAALVGSVGISFNRWTDWSLGGTFGREAPWGTLSRYNADLRLRRWITERTQVSFGPGVFWITSRRGDDTQRGYTTSARLLLGRAGIVSLRTELLPIEPNEQDVRIGILRDPGGWEKTLSLGVGLEGPWALGGGLLGVAAVGVLFAIALSAIG